VAAVDILEGSFHDVGQDADMDEVALDFAVFDFVEMDNHRSQTTLEYFVYMETALNRIPLAIAAHCATEAVEEVGQKDGLDTPLGKMLVKRMTIVLGWMFGRRLQRMIVSKYLLRCPSLDRSDWGGRFL
jgi:hypothetical protein